MAHACANRTYDEELKIKRRIVDRRRKPERRNRVHIGPDKTVDARGLSCPGPLMELIRALRTTPAGRVIELRSSVPGALKEVPFWVMKTGHEYLGSEEKDGYWRILVRTVK